MDDSKRLKTFSDVPKCCSAICSWLCFQHKNIFLVLAVKLSRVNYKDNRRRVSRIEGGAKRGREEARKGSEEERIRKPRQTTLKNMISKNQIKNQYTKK